MGNELLASKNITQEEAPQFRPVAGVATSVVGAEGVTEKGPFGATLVQSAAEYRRLFGGYVAAGDMAQAVDGFFGEGGGQLYVNRVVHYSDPTDPATRTSAHATATLQTAASAPTPGSVTSTAVSPFAMTPGDTLTANIDGGGDLTTTFSATAAARVSGAGTFNLTDGWTLLLSVDGGTGQTITFHTANFVAIAAATAAEVAAVINTGLVGAKADSTSSANHVTITSDKKGTASGINVTGGTANGALSFTTGNQAGTGNVANIAAVTAAEVVTAVNLATAGQVTTSVSGAIRLTSNTTGGASSVLIAASSSLDTVLGFDNATHTGSTGAAVDTLRVDGLYEGAYANALTVIVSNGSSGLASDFNFQVVKSGVIVETFPNLSMDAASSRYAPTIVNDTVSGSQYVLITDLVANVAAPGNQPARATSPALTGGNDGLAGLSDADFIGGLGATAKTGIRAFDLVPDLSLLIVPGRATSAVHAAMLTYCEVTRAKQVFAILDPPANQSASQIVTYVVSTAALLELSEFGAIYWPRIKVSNPAPAVFGPGDKNGLMTVAPSGYIAGIYARTDAGQPGGVYQPPAGTERGIINGCLGFETDEVLDQNKRDLVFPKRINPLSQEPGTPRFIDGARTLKSTSNFPSVSERRGVIFIEQSIKSNLVYARHSNNTEELRERIDRDVTVFLTDQMNVGAFRSKAPAKAFFTDFGDGLNPLSAVFKGVLNGRVGLATNKPAEFVIVSFSQDVRALATTT